MKSLTVIYAAVLVTGVVAFTFINSSINALATQNHPTPSGIHLNDESTQGGQDNEFYVLQPASVLSQAARVCIQQCVDDSIELQPALGYNALGWKVNIQ